MRDRGPDSQRLFVDFLLNRRSILPCQHASYRCDERGEPHPQFLVVLELAVHLNLERVHFELRRALGRVDVGAVVARSALGVQLSQDLDVRGCQAMYMRGMEWSQRDGPPC